MKTKRIPIHGKSAFHIKLKNGDNYYFGAVSDDAAEIASALENLPRAMAR